jgi:uncharacterized protein (TIGR00297 family)
MANTVALICAAGLLLADLWLHGGGNHLYIALLTTIAFALAARLARGVNTSGALAGACIAFILASHDLRMFWVLLIVFFITLAATRVGNSRKQELRIAEAQSGRSASQVMANLGIAALVLVVFSENPAVILAIAALVEVAADTTSSEIGTALSSGTVLISTWKPVPSGTDGGISLIGTFSGLAAAALTAGCAFAIRLLPLQAAIVAGCAGVAGMVVDSLLGALLERRGYLNNDVVNLLSTATAALIAFAVMQATGF